ncbi:MAG: recombinase family protein [Oligoflexus sp.]
MTTMAYLRVSRDDQDIKNQRLAILDYARRENVNIDRFIEIHISSRRTSQERGLDELLANLSAGDTLIVSEMSRLGRSVGEIINLVDSLIRKKTGLIAIKENIVLNHSQTLQSKVMITMFSLFADVERELISMRTRGALAALKATGKRLERPRGALSCSKLDGKEHQIRELLSLKVSKSSIAKITRVDRSTLLHFLKSRNIGHRKLDDQGV